MISLVGYVVVATLNGKQVIADKEVYKTLPECYKYLVLQETFNTEQGQSKEFQCFYIEGKPVKIEVKEIK